MKRIALILAMSFVMVTANSQEFSVVKGVTSGFYFTAGVNGAGLVGWEDPSNSGAGRIAGFHGGLTFWTKLGKSGRTQLAIEGNFSQQGFSNVEAVDDEDNEKLVINYFNVPLIVRYRPFPKFWQMYIGAGPQIGFKAGGHVKTVGGEKFELNDDALIKNSMSAVGVLGFNFGKFASLGIEFSYQHGLSGFIKDNKELRHSVYSARMMIPVAVLGAIIEGLGGGY
jgi:hypothetical protein